MPMLLPLVVSKDDSGVVHGNERLMPPIGTNGRIRPRRSLLLGALTLSVLLLLSACRSGEAEDGSGNEASAATPTSDSAAMQEEEILEAWTRYWDVYVAVGGELDLPDPRLAEVATGDALQAVNSGFLGLLSKGQAIRGDIDLSPELVSVDDGTAVLSDCYASNLDIYDVQSGESVGVQTSERTLVTVTMATEAGDWKVARVRHERDGCTATG